ncbi:MAG: 16S rRNA (guanine(527)-N(7))-methyltransferase RsmG [Bacilli bacterium]
MNEQQFINELKKLKIEVTNEEMLKLENYYKLLVEYNKKFNLTNIIDKKEVYLKHFYDSLTLFRVYNLNNNITLCDVGSGAGFPSIVLKIFFPNLNIIILDALEKRINFLNKVIKELKLVDIKAIHERVEIYALKNREKYDIVTARAVAPLNILLELCIPLVKINGYFLAMKGTIEKELLQATNALVKLDCSIAKIDIFELPFEKSKRTLLKMIKEKQTDKEYPRNFSKIKKKPL